MGNVTALRTRRPSGAAAWPLILLAGEAKTGKAQPLHSRLATPTGWTTMGEVAVGDQLIGSDGGPIVVTGVFDQGELPIYRLTFSDGSTTEACGDHLWATWTPEERHRRWQRGEHAGQPRRMPAKIRTTDEIRSFLLRRKNSAGQRTVYVPMAAPVRYAPRPGPLPVDPYVLGLLLGDGGLTKPSTPSFTSVDAELFHALEQRLPYGDYLRRIPGTPSVAIVGGHLVGGLREIGVMGYKSEEKHIPDMYLTASISDRLALLQGLMDTDGTLTRRTATTGGAAMFTTASPALAEGVRQLVESLGGTAATRTKTTSHLPAHELNIRLRKGMCPFRLARKVRAFDETRPTAHCPPRRGIRQVDYIGTMPARCISVSAEDSLYLTDNFIVTHNTYRAVEFTGDSRVGRSFVLDLGEGSADEYGAVPGADYEIIDHDGTWVDIIGQVEAVRDLARAELAAGRKPVCLIIDSMTAEWAMLAAWTDTRARRSKANRTLLAQDPDAEIDITANYWNDANSRHNRLMNILKTFPGIVIMTALETEKTQFGPGGKPVQGAPKVARPDAQKRLTADATVWVRLSLDSEPTIVGIRSLKNNITPGKDRPQPWPDFTLGKLVFEFMGIGADTAQVRDIPVLDADQVAPGEEADDPQPRPSGPRPVRTPEQNAAYAKAGTAKLLAAATVAEVTGLHRTAQADPAGRVVVFDEVGQDRRELLGIPDERTGLTLADLAPIVLGYVERRGTSVDAALDAANGGGAVAS